MSTDTTLTVADTFKRIFKSYTVLKNIHETTPYAINIGAKFVKGDYFFWISAHSVLTKKYIYTSIKTIQKYKVDSVGGLVVTDANLQKQTIVQRAISNCINSTFGSGNSAYRNKNINTIRSVDTVFGQCFDKNVFKKYGYFNENLTRCQDYEFNQRIVNNGGTILLNPHLVNFYYPPNTIRKFIRKVFTNGYWVVMSDYLSKKRFHAMRHYFPLCIISISIILIVGGYWFAISWKIFYVLIFIYMLINMAFSMISAISNKNIVFIFLQPLIFMILHFGYGGGSLYGILMYHRHIIRKGIV